MQVSTKFQVGLQKQEVERRRTWMVPCLQIRFIIQVIPRGFVETNFCYRYKLK
jgi:hypothetical protein